MTRGLDHGSWTLLHRMYPEANIPVVQISVNPFLSAKEQFEIGEALKGLGQEDILVIGSGVTVHNLRALKWNQTTPEKWAIEFDDWIIKHMQNNDKDALFNWEKNAPHAHQEYQEQNILFLYLSLWEVVKIAVKSFTVVTSLVH